MRAFIALPLPEDIRHTLCDIQNGLRSCHLEARWTPAENLHITLKFLGEIDETRVTSVQQIITRAANAFSSMTVNLNGSGFFPSARDPRVFFISTDHEGTLTSIVDFLENELEKLGIKKEKRFRSHITLARFRSAKNTDCIRRKMDIHPPQGTFPVNRIVLFQSTLSQKGARYDPAFTAYLMT